MKLTIYFNDQQRIELKNTENEESLKFQEYIQKHLTAKKKRVFSIHLEKRIYLINPENITFAVFDSEE